MKIIVGPLLQGTPQQRAHHVLTGEKQHRDTKLLLMLGNSKISALTTAQLRRWHSLVREEVGAHTANRVRSMLKGILALAEKDFRLRVCSMPTNLDKRKSKPKKDILTPEDVARLISHARSDKERGIFVAFPFLTGVRVSEQLGLQWQDVDLDRNGIHICRVQELDDTTTDTTKTGSDRGRPSGSHNGTLFLGSWGLASGRDQDFTTGLQSRSLTIENGPGLRKGRFRWLTVPKDRRR